jgi:hypothetical protein
MRQRIFIGLDSAKFTANDAQTAQLGKAFKALLKDIKTLIYHSVHDLDNSAIATIDCIQDAFSVHT